MHLRGINLQSKLPDVGTTIFTVMSKMAQDYDAINLSQGFPDFDCPDRLKELVAHYINDKRNQYPPMAGIPLLRQEISKKINSLYGFDANPETEVTVTSGATEALFDAVQATVHQAMRSLFSILPMIHTNLQYSWLVAFLCVSRSGSLTTASIGIARLTRLPPEPGSSSSTHPIIPAA
jgi:hypothetical protein